MKNHTKVYLDYFGYDTGDFIGCEICGKKAIDINHIKARGMGGSKLHDNIENLMAMCRECHVEYGDRQQFRDVLYKVHERTMQYRIKK